MAGEPVVETNEELRRTPLALPERPDPEIVVEDTGGSGGSDRRSADDDGALAAAKRATEAAETRARNAEAARQAAERDRDQARTAAGRAVVDERSASIDSQLEAAKNAKESAKGRLRAAREAQNYDEEEAAQEQLADASATIKLLERDKAYLDGEKKRAPATEGGGARATGDEVPPSEQQWVGAHPLFSSDPTYRSEVIGAANAAIARGMARGSPAYIEFVNERMSKMFGPGHGVAETHGKKANGGRLNEQFGDEPRRQRLTAMPRSAETEDFAPGNGARYVDTEFGRVEMTTGADGKPMIRMPTRVREIWSEAASWSGKKKDGTPKMTLGQYAMEQIAIAEEQRRGLTGGLTFDDERQVLR